MTIYSTDSLTYALQYAAKGWRLFPVHSCYDGACTCGKNDCGRPGKHPASRHGIKDGTTNADTIRNWDKHFQSLCNWAVVTGPESGLWSLDDDDQGNAIAKLEQEYGPLPITPRFRTGGGGEQRFFLWPTDGLGVKSQAKFLPGLDTRGDGGYCILPPSLHRSGKRYEWLVDPETPLALAPNWLLTLVRAGRSEEQQAGEGLTFNILPDKEDFTNAPGAVDGQRNAKVIELIGRHLARGDSVDRIEALAADWAEKCDPPLTEKEWQTTLRSLVRKHFQSQEESNTENEVRTNEESQNGTGEILRSFVPAPNGSPSPLLVDVSPLPELHPDVYHGLIGDILKAIAPETEADCAAILFQLLVAVGNGIGRGPHFKVGPGKHYPNLFTLVVGDTASAKGQSLEIVMSLMEQADPQWFNRCLCHGLSSGEGLIESVHDGEEDVDVDDTGDGVKINVTVTDEGAPDKRLLSVETEFAGPVKLMRREGNILSPLLRNAWDGKPLEVRNRRRNALRATDAHISLIGHITPEELDHELGGRPELANGFSNRFLFCRCWRRKLLPFGGNADVLNPFVKPLAQAIAKAKTIGECRRSPEADQLWAAVYPALAESKSGPYGRAVERARPQVMRIAMLYALLDGSAIIEETHLQAALGVWSYANASAKHIFTNEDNANKKEGEAKEEPLALRLLDAIKANPGLNRTGLHEALGRNRKAEEVETALGWLQEQGLAHSEKSSTGGRPGECWFPGTKKRTNEENPEPLSSSEEYEETNERRKSEQQGTQDLLRLFVPLSLAELVEKVTALPGRFVWKDNAVIVEAASVPDELAESCQQLQDELAGIVPKPVDQPNPYPDADAVIMAVYQNQGKIEKAEDGQTTLHLVKPDPLLEQAFQTHYDAISSKFYSELELYAELAAI